MLEMPKEPETFIKVGDSNIRRARGKPFKYVHVVRKGMTFKEAEELAQKIADQYAKKNKGRGRIWANLRYDIQFMGTRGGAQKLGEKIRLWTPDDYDANEVADYKQETFDEMTFWIDLGPTKKGGTDRDNDCLFFLLRRLLNGQERMNPLYNTPEKLKSALGLQRYDKISIDELQKVETFYRVNINVTGDYVYISPNKYKRAVAIQLINGHYEAQFDRVKEADLIKRDYNFKERPFLVYYVENGDVLLYDGAELRDMTYEQFKEFKEKNIRTLTFVNSKNVNIISEYDSYKADSEALKEATKGEINLLKSGNIHSHAKALFYRRSNGISKPDAIDQVESTFLDIKGSLIMGEKGEYENVVEYDVNSMYPFLMSLIMFPVKRGEIRTLEELPEKLEYGIYKCNIKPINKKADNLFRFNEENYYTHSDIMNARQIGLPVELIQSPNNALIYTKDKLEYGKRMFKPVVDYLYDLKVKKVPRTKEILNSLWGALTQRNSFSATILKEDDFVIPDNATVDKIYHIGHRIRIQYHFNDRRFDTDFARIGPFLTSYARFWMARKALPHLDHVIRIHTDSIMSTKPIEECKISAKIGEWKKLEIKKVIIHNNVIKEFL